MPRTSQRTAVFTESLIREMSRVAARHGAINLAQGFPDFEGPAEAREAAVLAKEKEYQAREEQAALEKESTRLQTEFPDIWGDPSTEEAPPQLERFVELLGKGLTERQAAVLVRDEFRLAAPAQAVVPSPAKKAETVVPQPEEEVVEPAAVKQKPLPSSVQAMGRPGISPGGLQETAGARDHENLSDYFDRVLYKGRR